MQSLKLSNRSKWNTSVIFVTQSSNSFGDQVLTFRKEFPDGSSVAFTTNLPEGNWEPFTKKSMLSLAKVYERMGYLNRKDNL